MSPRELQWIKQKQKEFKETFGKPLEIDFLLMNDVQENVFVQKIENNKKKIYSLFRECLEAHSFEEKDIKKNERGRFDKKFHPFLKDFCREVVAGNFDLRYAGSLLKSNRTIIYHYYKKALE